MSNLPRPPKDVPGFVVDKDGNNLPVQWYKPLRDWLYQIFRAVENNVPQPPPPPSPPPPISADAAASAAVARIGLPIPASSAGIVSTVQALLPVAPTRTVDQTARDLAYAAVRLPLPLPYPQIVVCTQATFPVLVSGTVPTFIFVSDYVHMMYWNGSSCIFTDGGNCFIALFDIDPGAGWHLLDGSPAVPYLMADGTLGAYDLETAVVPFYLKAGFTNSGPNAAIAPSISGQTEVATTGITVSGGGSPTVVTGTAAAGITQPVVVSVTGGGGGGGVTDPGHFHTLLAADAPITDDGEPINLTRRPYFRQ